MKAFQHKKLELVVFIVTPHPFSQKDINISPTEAQSWLPGGLNILPDPIGQKVYLPEYTCTALVYEFEQYGSGEKPELKIPGRLSGKIHLTKANLWQALEKLP